MSGHQNYINLGTKPYEKGLLDLGNNSYAYLQPDGGWGDSERIAVNVNSLYREFNGEKIREDVTLLFSQMAELHFSK